MTHNSDTPLFGIFSETVWADYQGDLRINEHFIQVLHGTFLDHIQ